MKIPIFLFITALSFSSCSHPRVEGFQKEACSLQEEAESYYLLQRLLAKEYAIKASPKVLDRYLAKFSKIRSLTFTEKKEDDLVGWTKMEREATSGDIYGYCITPVYHAKKKILLGYLVGKYLFQTRLKNTTIGTVEGPAPFVHEKLKFSHALLILPVLSPSF